MIALNIQFNLNMIKESHLFVDESSEICYKGLRDNTTVIVAFQPWRWFQLQGFVNESRAIKQLGQAGNAELGNRFKDRFGCTYVSCPWCLAKGRLVESYVILVCQSLAGHRKDFGISDFHSNAVNHGNKLIFQVLSAYLRGVGQTHWSYQRTFKKVMGRLFHKELIRKIQPVNFFHQVPNSSVQHLNSVKNDSAVSFPQFLLMYNS